MSSHIHTSRFLYQSILRGAAFGLLLLSPFAARAQTGISVGYTGMHDGQRGQVYMFDYVPQGSPWDFTAGAIHGTATSREKGSGRSAERQKDAG